MQGNIIGWTPPALTAAEREGRRRHHSASGNQIGGIVSGARNVISANGDAGIFIGRQRRFGQSGAGNYIGTDSSGTLARGNLSSGIYMQQAAQI